MRRLLAAGAVAVAVLAGCATPVAGTPVPVPEDPAVTVELPPRPREVRVDGVDPCTLLTPTDRAELQLDSEPRLTTSSSGLYNGGEVRLCTLRSSVPGVGRVGVLLSVTGGIEVFLQPGVRAAVTPTKIGGFPAVVADPTAFSEFCDAVVDVAPQQVVDVDYADGGNTPRIPQDALCREAERVAEIVMRNLVDQAG